MKLVYKKNIKAIHNATVREKDDVDTFFQRISPTEFERIYKSPHWICTGCGEFLDEQNESQHRNCAITKMSEESAANAIASLVADDELNVLEINNGYDDQCYISF